MPGDEVSDAEDDRPVGPAPAGEATRPPSARVEALEERIADLEDTLQDRTEALARVQNQYDNYRRRADREKENVRREVRSELVDTLAGVLDDVQRALDANPDENVRIGLEMVVQRIENRLTELGATLVRPEPGQAFDPARHEALVTEASEDHEADTVIEVLEPGFEFDDELVRAARVKVAKAPKA